MSPPKQRTRWFALILVAVSQISLLPVAIGLTIWHNDPNRMPLFNEMAWGCVPSAQTVLATLFLAFGAGPPVIRFTVTVVALILILLSTGWAYAVLGVFENPWAELPCLSAYALVPAILSGLVLSLLRPWVGTARWTNHPDDVRHGILDLLLTTLLVSVTLSWYRYAVSAFAGQSVDSWTQSVDSWTIVVSNGLSSLGGVSCLLLVMGRRRLHSVIGGAGLATHFTVMLSLYSHSMWFHLLSPSVIVIFTLVALHGFGVRLGTMNGATTK